MVSLNYLSTVLFQTAGVQLSPYQEYLADLRMEHPVITARYFTTAFGNKVARCLRRSPIRSVSISGFNTTACLIEPIAFQGSIHRKAGVSIYGGLVMVPCKENGCFAKISICV